jgi:hypothetical protein
MSDKELNTPRELTSEELDIVTGGAFYQDSQGSNSQGSPLVSLQGDRPSESLSFNFTKLISPENGN